MPEKVLGTTEAWAQRNPQTLRALIKALLEACQWLDEPDNRAEAARVLASPRYLNTPAEVIARALDCPTSICSIATTPTSPGAATPTGSWSRWCAGARRPSPSISGTSPTAYSAPIFIAPRPPSWDRLAPRQIACRKGPRQAGGSAGHGSASCQRPAPRRLTKSNLGSTTHDNTQIAYRNRSERESLAGAAVVAAQGLAPRRSRCRHSKVEKDELKFGFIKLTDMAPLAIAKEKGFFEDEGPVRHARGAGQLEGAARPRHHRRTRRRAHAGRPAARRDHRLRHQGRTSSPPSAWT